MADVVYINQTDFRNQMLSLRVEELYAINHGGKDFTGKRWDDVYLTLEWKYQY